MKDALSFLPQSSFLKDSILILSWQWIFSAWTGRIPKPLPSFKAYALARLA
jgi:hypothetical protein